MIDLLLHIIQYSFSLISDNTSTSWISSIRTLDVREQFIGAETCSGFDAKRPWKSITPNCDAEIHSSMTIPKLGWESKERRRDTEWEREYSVIMIRLHPLTLLSLSSGCKIGCHGKTWFPFFPDRIDLVAFGALDFPRGDKINLRYRIHQLQPRRNFDKFADV